MCSTILKYARTPYKSKHNRNPLQSAAAAAAPSSASCFSSTLHARSFALCMCLCLSLPLILCHTQRSMQPRDAEVSKQNLAQHYISGESVYIKCVRQGKQRPGATFEQITNIQTRTTTLFGLNTSPCVFGEWWMMVMLHNHLHSQKPFVLLAHCCVRLFCA